MKKSPTKQINTSRLNMIVALVIALAVLLVGYTLYVTMAATVDRLPTSDVPAGTYDFRRP